MARPALLLTAALLLAAAPAHADGLHPPACLESEHGRDAAVGGAILGGVFGAIVGAAENEGDERAGGALAGAIMGGLAGAAAGCALSQRRDETSEEGAVLITAEHAALDAPAGMCVSDMSRRDDGVACATGRGQAE